MPRKVVEFEGRTIYEWEQNLEEVDIYIDPPPGITAKILDITIARNHLSIGVKGNPPYIDNDFPKNVKTDESMWMMEDGELHINLQKAVVGETWECAMEGHAALSAAESKEVQETIMKERFSRENPGFDFSQAKFNGDAPNPTTFMGGVDNNKIRETR